MSILFTLCLLFQEGVDCFYRAIFVIIIPTTLIVGRNRFFRERKEKMDCVDDVSDEV